MRANARPLDHPQVRSHNGEENTVARNHMVATESRHVWPCAPSGARRGRGASTPGFVTPYASYEVPLMIDPNDLASIQARAVERGCTKEAVDRFAERYPQHCRRRENGKPIAVVPRLRMALELARSGKGIKRAAHNARWIFDEELPADAWNPEPYTIRIVTDAAVTCVLTVLPLEFRAGKHAKVKKQFHRSERKITEPESTESVALPPPVRTGTNLGDLLRAAMSK